MGLRAKRSKAREPLLAFAYAARRTMSLLPSRRRLKLFLDWEWIFHRFAHEESHACYSPDEHPMRQETLCFIRRHIGVTSRVLDLGCSRGFYAYWLSEFVWKVTGVDSDPDAIAFARSHHNRDNLTYEQAEAREYLDKHPGEFDELLLIHVLEHLDEPEAFIKECKPHFRQIYVEVPDFEASYLQYYRKDLGASLIYTDSDHVSEFDRGQMREIFLRCGLRVTQEDHRFGVLKYWCAV
jgi:SAM-dependent methyltransferase